MTVGDTICLKYNDRNYFLDVREVRPAEAACIIETDCEVDFEAPADYVEPKPPPVPSQTTAPFGGTSMSCSAFDSILGMKHCQGFPLCLQES